MVSQMFVSPQGEVVSVAGVGMSKVGGGEYVQGMGMSEGWIYQVYGIHPLALDLGYPSPLHSYRHLVAATKACAVHKWVVHLLLECFLPASVLEKTVTINVVSFLSKLTHFYLVTVFFKVMHSLLGEEGIGKSSTLAMLALDWAEDKAQPAICYLCRHCQYSFHTS